MVLDVSNGQERHRALSVVGAKQPTGRPRHGKDCSPPYPPDLNTIELLLAKLKALLCQAAARLVDDL